MDGVSPIELMNAINASKASDGLGGATGGWFWLIIIFLFFGGFGNGFGGGSAMNTLSNEFLYTNLNAQGTGIANGICSLGYEVAQQFGTLSRQMSECCCSTQRAIDGVNYQAAINTRDILESNCSNTQKILDKMSSMEIQQLRDQLLAAQLTLSNASQTSTIISTLQPTPVPAYVVSSPYCPVTTGA